MRDRIVVVGASLAGLRAAEGILACGFGGELLIVGDEELLPYSRPPLSKKALSMGESYEPEFFRRKDNWDDIRWRLGREVVSSSLGQSSIELDTGEQIEFDALVVASGLRPRRMDVEGPLTGRYVVRTVHDAQVLRAVTTPTTNVVVIGGGFLGCEIAASMISNAASVTQVISQSTPLDHILGTELGARVRQRHERAGVCVITGQTVTRVVGDDRAEGVLLSSGEFLEAGVVVEAVGAIPNTEWLSGNGLDLSDGVLCDNQMRVVGAQNVVAAGDIARFPNPLFSDHCGRFEHWNMAPETARCAAHSLMARAGLLDEHREPFVPIPSFWSDQFELRIQAFGDPRLGRDDRRELHRDDENDELVMGYYLDDVLMGAAGIGSVKRLLPHRALLADRAARAQDLSGV